MFDEVEEDEVCAEFSDSAMRVHQCTGHHGVAVSRDSKHFARLCGRGQRPGFAALKNRKGTLVPSGRDYVGFEEVERFLYYGKATAFSRVGTNVFRRKRGVTMGGAESPAKAGVVYRGHERRHLRGGRAWQRWQIAHLQNRGVRLCHLIKTARIADDDFSASSVLCARCLARAGSAVYPPPLGPPVRGLRCAVRGH